MRVYPPKDMLESFILEGYDILPLSIELLSDFTTPIETLRRLQAVSSHVFLLESAKENETFGRYSFLGYDPRLEITCLQGKMKVGDLELDVDDPEPILRDLLSHYRSPRLPSLPPLCGGLVGWFSCDYLSYSEPILKNDRPDPDGFRDLDLMLFDKIIAFDHLRQKIILIANMDLHHPETSWNKTLLTLQEMKELVRHGQKASDPGGRLTGSIVPQFEKEQYCRMVEQARHLIYEGDLFQIVLSNRLSAPFEGSLLNTYRMLRTINPSPYMFYFCGSDVETAGASPETLIRLDQGELSTYPLAGTRPRQASPKEDRAMMEELLADTKELAEHDMLVDLGRSDLGKVAKVGSVRVESLHDVLLFSHVMHIGSTLKAEIDENCDALDALRAVLPAGTLSGAPRLRAMQRISELEGIRRGIYGGAIGYLDFTGSMDMCIAIRLAYHKNGKVFVQSGAGIVADSVPEKEFEECLNKARATLFALERAQEELE